MTKEKTLNLLLILASFIVYLEWGVDNKMFLFQGEIELFAKFFTNPLSVIHPFTLLPLLGQFLLIVTLFQKNPSKKLIYFGLACLSILILFIFVIGIIGFNLKIIISTFPFLILGIYEIWWHRKSNKKHYEI